MPRTARKISNSGYYHVMAKGINREKPFNQEREKKYFMKTLVEHLEKYEIKIYAYCIMSNHVHLIIKADIEELSMFMARILAQYAEYYNYKHHRNGHVFQNRFKSDCIEDEIYFWTCLRYIHLNPVKARVVTSPMNYKYCSMEEYVNGKGQAVHNDAVNMLTSKFENMAAFTEYHQGKCCKVFLDVPQEILCQFKEIAMIILNQFQMKYQLKNPIEVIEDKKIREKYKTELRMTLNLSKNKIEMLCMEIAEIIKEK